MDSDLNLTVNGEDSYRVEVSGWDAKENFFVEKTTSNGNPTTRNRCCCGRYSPGLHRVCPAAPAAGNRRQFPDRL